MPVPSRMHVRAHVSTPVVPHVTASVVVPVVPYGVTPSFPHIGFVADTMITCKVDNTEQAVAVQNLKPGMLVKTADAFRAVDKIGSRVLSNPSTADRLANRLYLLSKANYPSLTADLTMTGNRAILTHSATDADRHQMIEVMGRICVADKKFCIPCAADANATISPLQGDVTIYNFSLVNPCRTMVNGVYANGLLVDHSSMFHMANAVYTQHQ